MNKLFTKAQVDWILANHKPEKTIREFVTEYNKTFNETRSVDVFKHKCKALGLKQQAQQSFTQEENEWLIQNAPLHSVEETAKLFNDLFNCNRSAQVLKVHCNRTLKVKHLNSRHMSTTPIGTETVLNGYVYVKVRDDLHGRNTFYKAWKPKHLLVWEEYYGEVPKGKQIVFLNRNHMDYNIENLYAVDGRILREMVKKKWFNTNPELTLTAIKWCELFYAVKYSE